VKKQRIEKREATGWFQGFCEILKGVYYLTIAKWIQPHYYKVACEAKKCHEHFDSLENIRYQARNEPVLSVPRHAIPTETAVRV
jgi:hypothetical protein